MKLTKYTFKVSILVILFASLTACQTFNGAKKEAKVLGIPQDSDHASIRWSTSVGAGEGKNKAQLALAQVAEQLITVDYSGSLRVTDSKNGKNLLKKKLGNQINSGVAANEEYIVVVNDQAMVQSYAQETGELLWEVAVSSEAFATPVIDGNLVFVKTIDGKVYALDALTGEKRWFYEQEIPALTLRQDSSPVSVDDKLIVGFADGTLVALHRTTGALLWQTLISAPQGSTPVQRLVDVVVTPLVSGEFLFVVNYQGQLAKVGLNSGQIDWRKPLSSMSGFALNQGQLFVTDTEGRLLALDENTGTQLFAIDQLKKHQLSAPAVVDGLLLVLNEKGLLYLMDKKTGQWLGEKQVVKSRVRSPILISGNKVYILDDKGRLAAVELKVSA